MSVLNKIITLLYVISYTKILVHWRSFPATIGKALHLYATCKNVWIHQTTTTLLQALETQRAFISSELQSSRAVDASVPFKTGLSFPLRRRCIWLTRIFFLCGGSGRVTVSNPPCKKWKLFSEYQSWLWNVAEMHSRWWGEVPTTKFSLTSTISDASFPSSMLFAIIMVHRRRTRVASAVSPNFSQCRCCRNTSFHLAYFQVSSETRASSALLALGFLSFRFSHIGQEFRFVMQSKKEAATQ